MTQLNEQDREDLEDFLKIYRTLKNAGKFFVWVLGIAFLIASTWLAIKQSLK